MKGIVTNPECLLSSFLIMWHYFMLLDVFSSYLSFLQSLLRMQNKFIFCVVHMCVLILGSSIFTLQRFYCLGAWWKWCWLHFNIYVLQASFIIQGTASIEINLWKVSDFIRYFSSSFLFLSFLSYLWCPLKHGESKVMNECRLKNYFVEALLSLFLA